MRPMRGGRAFHSVPGDKSGVVPWGRKGDEWDSTAIAQHWRNVCALAGSCDTLLPRAAIVAPEPTMSRLLAVLLAAVALTASAADEKPDLAKIRGKIQFVSSFPDYKVKVVDSFADLHVKLVESFPDEPGEWQIVESFPDYKIQLVDSFPDFTIHYVESFPGVR